MSFVSASEAARKMGIPQTTISKWCLAGRVPGAMKVSNMWLVPADITLADIDRPRMGRPRKAAVETLPPPESKNGRSQEENGR